MLQGTGSNVTYTPLALIQWWMCHRASSLFRNLNFFREIMFENPPEKRQSRKGSNVEHTKLRAGQKQIKGRDSTRASPRKTNGLGPHISLGRADVCGLLRRNSRPQLWWSLLCCFVQIVACNYQNLNESDEDQTVSRPYRLGKKAEMSSVDMGTYSSVPFLNCCCSEV